jgi:apolipoprotein N-acyltransferase
VPVEPLTRLLLNLGVVLMFAYLGLYTGVFALVVRRLGIWTAPLAWPLLELLLSQSQIAFPWNLLGASMTPWLPFANLAALGGVYLVSAWVVLVNALVHKLLFDPRRVRFAVALVIAFALPVGWYALRARPLSPWFTVAVVQPDVSPLDKGDWDSREKIQADLLRLTRQAAAEKPDLIVFPETATLVDVTRSGSIGPALRALVDSLGVELFTGSPLYDDARRSWHNGATLLRPGEWPPVQHYYKMFLVPFSEKIPYSDELPIIRKLIGTSDMGDWARGHDWTVFNWRKGTLSAHICFEIVFPQHARAMARRGSMLLVNVTNDGWFGKLPGAYQHTELSVMRAIETGLPLVRSANNGVSMVVSPYGRVIKRTRLFEQALLVADVPEPALPPPYRIWGDWPLTVFCLAGLAVALVLRLRRRVRHV